jgi:hypothetical protein
MRQRDADVNVQFGSPAERIPSESDARGATIHDLNVAGIEAVHPKSFDHSFLCTEACREVLRWEGLSIAVAELAFSEQLCAQLGMAIKTLLKTVWLQHVDPHTR